MRSFKLNIILIVLAVFGVFQCSLKDPFSDRKKDQLIQNSPPQTHLFLLVNQTVVIDEDTLDSGQIVHRQHITGLDTTASKQVLHWWGDDPDGKVTGYYYQWDFDSIPTYTTQEYDTFYVPIRSDYDEFSFTVWAVDDQGAQDPTPASLRFPIYNTPPFIRFALGSNPSSPNNPNVTHYTFPTRSFFWEVEDADGRATVTKILYALDDTTQWSELSGDVNQMTFTEATLDTGYHQFFVKAQDISGASSNVIMFPDPNDSDVPNYWKVKAPKGRILLVNDYAQDQNLYTTQTFYENILKNDPQVMADGGYSVWEIGTNKTPVFNPQNALPYSSIDIEANFRYFDKVIWFSYLGEPNISDAGLSMTRFVKNGGKLLITNGNSGEPDTTWTFTNIDSVYILNPTGRLMKGVGIVSDLDIGESGTLDMQLGKLLAARVHALIPGPGADIIFRMQPDSTFESEVPYTGSPAVGIRYRVGEGECLYLSVPLHFCDGLGNVADVLNYLLFDEFE